MPRHPHPPRLVRDLNRVTPVASAVKFVIGKGSEANVVVRPIGTDAKVIGAAVPARKPRPPRHRRRRDARAENWSFSGYGRETDAGLKTQDITYFPKATSCGTSTAVSIPCLFSVYTRSDYSHRKGIETENLVDVLRHAGVTVNWWDNNTGSYKVAARIQEVSFPAMNDPAFCKDGECQDGMFLKEIDKWIGTITEIPCSSSTRSAATDPPTSCATGRIPPFQAGLPLGRICRLHP